MKMNETLDLTKLMPDFMASTRTHILHEMNYEESYLRSILGEIEILSNLLAQEEELHEKELAKVHPDHKISATNLICYRALRTKDLSRLQNALGYLGISRLARAQRHVKGSLMAIKYILQKLLDETGQPFPRPELSIQQGMAQLDENSKILLGPTIGGRRVRIMVTLPSAAAEDRNLTRDIVSKGTNCVRINCAHDDPVAWKKMIDNVKLVSADLGREVKVAMDLAGPKIRTGGIKTSIKVHEDDMIYIHKTLPPKDQRDPGGHHITCTSKKIFASLKPGESILFDDGKISAQITEVTESYFAVKVRRADMDGSRLKPDKGINLPDTSLKLDGLTGKDIRDLEFVAKHADIVNISFINTPKDVEEVFKELKKYDVNGKLGIVLKIETKNAFMNLTPILLYSMRWYPVGVMIARGDLAVETGWENMARLQTEIVNICSAAHVPVIWATQVLENLAKKGVPSRSEITDAAASLKAECVMLNKGPYINKAISFLDTVLSDMEFYQSKSSAMTPRLDM